MHTQFTQTRLQKLFTSIVWIERGGHDEHSLLIENKVFCVLKKVHFLGSTYRTSYINDFYFFLLILSKIADVGLSKTPTPLASANIGNGDPPSPPKTCRRLKWMVPYM